MSAENQWLAAHALLGSRPPIAERDQRSARDTLRLLSKAANRIARHQKASAALAFWSKARRDPEAQADWIEFILKHYHDFKVSPLNSRLLRKPQRNYGVTGRSVRDRVISLVHHYRFVAAKVPPKLHRVWLGTESIHIASLDGRGVAFDLWLGSSMTFGQKQEGELTLWLTNADRFALARMAFSIATDANGNNALLIGGLQGLPAGADKRIIVTATRALSGLRPKDAALVGVQAVADAWGIERVLAVSNQTHVLAAEWVLSKSIINRDYDGFWKERGGLLEPGVGYFIPSRDYVGRAQQAVLPRLIDIHRASLTEQVRTRLAA